MTINTGKSFDVDNGLSFSEGPFHFIVKSGVPTFSAPDGSICLSDNKKIYDRVSGAWIVRISGGKQAPKIVSWSADGQSYLKGSQGDYEILARVPFAGTQFGSPEKLKILARIKDSGKRYSVKIYDVTNNKKIAEKTNLTNYYFEIKDLGSLANLSSGYAVWEIQFKSNGGEYQICGMVLEY